MMMIVRLFPKTDLNKVWHYVENVIGKETSDVVTPLYSAQLEGMMSVGVIFDVKDPEIIWLSPHNHYGESYIVDMSLLDQEKLRPTYQAEGNFWHLGDIPSWAIVGWSLF